MANRIMNLGAHHATLHEALELNWVFVTPNFIQDMHTMRGDINTMRGDINTMRGDINTVRGDINALKQGLNQLLAASGINPIP